MKIGFLGCGKIGHAMMQHILKENSEVAFVQDPFFKEKTDFPVLEEPCTQVYETADIIVECATAGALKENFDAMIAAADLLIFSLTSFSDADFRKRAMEMTQKSGHHIYFPHGAILGLDGIFDAKPIITAASIETTKSPKSLGLTLTERKVVYEGNTLGACDAFPRNVNVHAAVAIAGIGFERTQSRIIADPAVNKNSHKIHIEGEGIQFTIEVSSFTTGGVTGVYTPLSACGSLDRLLQKRKIYSFV